MKLKRVEVMKSVTEKLGWFKSQIELENEINFYDNNIGSFLKPRYVGEAQISSTSGNN